MKELRQEEYNKAKEFVQATESGGISTEKRKKTYADKNFKILEASNLLENGKISAMAFLNRLIYKKNNICINMDNFENVASNIEIENDENSSDKFDNNVPTNDSPSLEEALLCIVCQVQLSNIVLLPCKHLKICNECFLKLQAHALADEGSNNILKCPYCRQIVETSLQIFL